MRKNVSYSECTCDVCGKVEHITQSLLYPKGWGTISFPMGEKLEVCDKCLLRIQEAISKLKHVDRTELN